MTKIFQRGGAPLDGASAPLVCLEVKIEKKEGTDVKQRNRREFLEQSAALVLTVTLTGCGGGGGGGTGRNGSSGGGSSSSGGGSSSSGSTLDWNDPANPNQPLLVTGLAQSPRVRAPVDPTQEDQFEPQGCPNGTSPNDGGWVAWHTTRDNPGNDYTVYVGSFGGNPSNGDPNARLASAGVAVFTGANRKHQNPAIEAFADFSALVCAESNEATGGGNLRVAARRVVDNGDGTASLGTTLDSISGSSGEQRNPRNVPNMARSQITTVWEEQGGTPGLACQRHNVAGLVGGNITIDSGDCRISKVVPATDGVYVTYDKTVGELRNALAAFITDGGGVTVITLANPIVSAQTGTLTISSPVVTGIADTSVLAPGMRVLGADIQTGARVLSVDSPTQVTLTSSATASGAQSLTFGGDASFPRIDVATESDGVEYLYGCWSDSRSGAFQAFGGKWTSSGTPQWGTDGSRLATAVIQGSDRGVDVACHPNGGATYLMEEIVDATNSAMVTVRVNKDGAIARARAKAQDVARQVTLPSIFLDNGFSVHGLWNGPGTVNYTDVDSEGNGAARSFGAVTPNPRRKVVGIPLANGRLLTVLEETRSGKQQVVERVPHR